MDLSQVQLVQLATNPIEFALWADNNHFINISQRSCNHCHGPVNLQRREEEADKVCLRCEDPNCRRMYSIRLGSFFEDSKIPIFRVLLIFWCFENDMSGADTASIAGVHRHTVSKYFARIRNLISVNLVDDPLVFDEVGVYEADETFYEHLHVQQNVFVEQQWVAGFLERESGRVKIYTVANRSAQQIAIPLLNQIPPGSLVCTDSFPSYNGLSPQFKHHSVNHSAEEYEREDNVEDFGPTSIHINTMENLWHRLKKKIENKQYRTLVFLDSFMDALMYKCDGRNVFNLIKI